MHTHPTYSEFPPPCPVIHPPLPPKQGMSPKHEPTVAVAKCAANVGDLGIELHGGASWL